MPPPGPTPLQHAILDLLTEYEHLTTRQIWAYMPTTASARTRRDVLTRLERRGWVQSAMLYPERGTASPRYWTLTPVGAAVAGVHYTAPQLTTLAEIRQALEPGPVGPVGVGANAARVLALLAEWKQLTTSQIWQYLDPDKPRRYTQQLLWRLQQQRMIRGVDLSPRQGTRSEHYWLLLERGAQALGIAYGQQYRRRPTTAVIQYRGMQLALRTAVESAGWQLIAPHPAPQKPDPQEQQLIAAVLAQEGHTLAALRAQGQPPEQLQSRQDRYKQGLVGAMVPDVVPDYVAYDPSQPERTVVIIPHPPYATRAFWSHRREQALNGSSRRRPARVDLYGRLAVIIPVVAVFATVESSRPYAPLLQRAGFQWLVVDQLADWLRGYTPW